MDKEAVVCVYSHKGTLLNHIKKNEILPDATAWMDLKGIILSEKKYCMILHIYVQSKEYNKLVNITKHKQTRRYGK